MMISEWGAGLTVLVIADEHAEAASVAAALQPLAAIATETVCLDDGGVAGLSARAADIIVLCVHVPAQAPVTLLGSVHNRWPNAPVVVVSGSLHFTDARALLEAGAFEFLSKQDLARLPEAVLRATRFRQALSAQQATRAQKQAWEMLCDQLPVPVLFADHTGHPVFVNQAFEALTGFLLKDLLAGGADQDLLEFRLAAPSQQQHDPRGGHALLQRHLRFRSREGALIQAREMETVLRDPSGNLAGRLKLLDERAAHVLEPKSSLRFEHYDELTGLPNRTLALDRLEHAIASGRRGGQRVAVMFVDVDHFKEVNDRFGHDVGDRVLRASALRLLDNLRKSATVARVGGDEFIVIVPDIDSLTHLEMLAERLVQASLESIEIRGQCIPVTISIGVAVCPEDASDATTLIKYADMAMYKAKQVGRSTYRFYDTSMTEKTLFRHRLEHAFERALEARAVTTLLEPLVEVTAMDVVGVRALPEWRDEELGFIERARFVPLAERHGQGLALFAHTLDDAVRAVSASAGASIVVWCEISRAALIDQNCLGTMESILGACDFPPHMLTLEVSEALFADLASPALARLFELADLGVQIAVSGVGLGGSPMAYLTQYPISQIALSPLPVPHGPASEQARKLIQGWVGMAGPLSLGVAMFELGSADNLRFMRELGPLWVAGGAIAEPVTPDGLAALLDGWQGADHRSVLEGHSASA